MRVQKRFQVSQGSSATRQLGTCAQIDTNSLLARGSQGAAQAAAGVTRRTRRVLSFLQRQFAEAEASAPPAKQRRGAGAASPVAAFQGVPLGPLLHGKTRAEASRMFYEVLVLNSRGLVAAQQGESFGEITLMPGKALIAGS